MMSYSLYSPLPTETIGGFGEPSSFELAMSLDIPDVRDEIPLDLDLPLISPVLEQIPYIETFDLPEFLTSPKTQKNPVQVIPKQIKQAEPPKKSPPQLSTSLSSFISNMHILQNQARAASKQKESHQKPKETEEVDEEFAAALKDSSLSFNPCSLGFIPHNKWDNKTMSFGEVVQEFFQRKNNANCRFSYKLYNALKLAAYDPKYEKFVGVKWITNEILRVDKKVFARLLGIKTIDGSLFHRQGNFPSHGFVEMTTSQVQQLKANYDVHDVDFENIRLLTHIEKVFVKDCTEDDLEGRKWINSRPKKINSNA